MSTLFDGPNKAPKVDTYELSSDLAAQASLSNEGADLSEFQAPDPEFQAALKWAAKPLSDAGVAPTDIDPSLGEIMRAAFQQENTIGSLISRKTPDDDTPDISPEELYTRAENEGLLPYLDNFRGVQTEGEYEAIKANLQRELDNRRILDAAGWGGTVAVLGAAVLDPVNFIPVGGAGVRIAKLATRGGKAAVESSVAGALGVTMAEGALHSTQETRTVAQSVIAVAAGTVLGGVLGMAVDNVFGHEIASRAADHYDNVRTGKATTTGAAAVGDLDKAIDERFANDAKLSSLGVNASLEVFEKIPVIGKHLASPARVLARSYSGAARKAMAMLVSDPSVSKANAAGRRSLDNVEAAFGAVKGQFGEARNEITSLFNKNKAAYGKSREVFNTKLAHALASGDKSDDEVITRAAKVLRARVFDPIRSALVENGVLKTDEAELLNAESYFPLVYSPDSIRGDQEAFEQFHEAVFSRVIHEDARQALAAKSIRQSDIEDTVIEHKGVRQRVPKFEDDGVTPVINKKTGKQVMTERIITTGQFKSLRDEAMATFEAEAKELRSERDDVIKAFNKGEDWPYAGPAELDNPFVKQFEARDKIRAKTNDIDRDLSVSVETARVTRDLEIQEINKLVSDFETLAANKSPKSPDAAGQQQIAQFDAELATAIELVNTVKKMELEAIKQASKAVDVKTATPSQIKSLGKAEANDIAKAEREATDEIERLTASNERRKKALTDGKPVAPDNAKKVYKLQERAIAKAKSEADKFIKQLEEAAAKKRAPPG